MYDIAVALGYLVSAVLLLWGLIALARYAYRIGYNSSACPRCLREAHNTADCWRVCQ